MTPTLSVDGCHDGTAPVAGHGGQLRRRRCARSSDVQRRGGRDRRRRRERTIKAGVEHIDTDRVAGAAPQTVERVRRLGWR